MHYSGVILAGGESQRMGQDKRFLFINGKPLIVWTVEQLRSLVEEIILVTLEPELFHIMCPQLVVASDVRLVTDRYPGLGVLAGLHAGLAEAQGDWAFVVAGDMPMLNSALLYTMATLTYTERADIIVPRWHGELEPLHALYRPSVCAPAAEAVLLQGRRRIISFYSTMRVRIVDEDEVAHVDPKGNSFFNVNTPHEWQMALQYLEARN